LSRRKEGHVRRYGKDAVRVRAVRDAEYDAAVKNGDMRGATMVLPCSLPGTMLLFSLPFCPLTRRSAPRRAQMMSALITVRATYDIDASQHRRHGNIDNRDVRAPSRARCGKDAVQKKTIFTRVRRCSMRSDSRQAVPASLCEETAAVYGGRPVPGAPENVCPHAESRARYGASRQSAQHIVPPTAQR